MKDIRKMKKEEQDELAFRAITCAAMCLFFSCGAVAQEADNS